MKNFDSVRNVLIPLGIGRPIKSKKYLFVAIVSILLSLSYKYLTVTYVNSVILDLLVVGMIISGVSFMYDKIHYIYHIKILDKNNVGVIIGHSNKVLVLEGQNVIKEYDCDAVIIRPADAAKDNTYEKYSSVIQCVKNNVITTNIIVDRIKEFENTVLFPNLDRVNEDIEVIYEE